MSDTTTNKLQDTVLDILKPVFAGNPEYARSSRKKLGVVRDVARLIEAATTEAREEKEDQIKLIQKKLHKLNAALFAVAFYLDKPYPDDSRWTPNSRFVEPALKMLSEATFNNKYIGELAAMAILADHLKAQKGKDNE